MANKNPNPTTRFKKGQSGNPAGRIPLPPELKKISNLSAEQFRGVCLLLFFATLPEVRAIAEDPKVPALNSLVAKMLLVAHREGDIRIIDKLLDRVIGPVKEKLDVQVFKPSLLVRRDGSKVEFGHEKVGEEE